ncbi:MAG: glycoside hydrolase family 3 C-terminal domain-containing protein [Solirubrobacteraceae bacterium]|jgi:beta-glucosidase
MGADSAERDLAARVASLTLEQKIRLLTGADFWSVHPEPQVGLRRLVVSDGPAGVRGERWDERSTSANVPSPTALAASWDEGLVEELGGLLAYEARRKGVDVLLAPTLNLHRTPYGGRHFECFSEDPLLTARIGVAYVRGVQNGGVAATAKHFIANDSETERMTLNARVDERTLRELYLAPFEAVVTEAGVWSVMASYNRTNEESMTESSRLRAYLHGELGFDGLVMSDWFATRSTVAAARAALDLAMPGPAGPWGDALVAAVRNGTVDETAIDDKVLRLLRLAARTGALEPHTAAASPHFDDAQIAVTLRRAAAASFVLVRNETGLLPLDRAAIRRLAVIGPNAAVARTLGGGSATVFPPYTVSPLEGLTAALAAGAPTVEVEHRLGALATTRIPVAGPPWLHRRDGGAGVEVRFIAADGSVLGTEHRPGCAFNWANGFDCEGTVASVEVHTVLRATAAGTYTVAASGIGHHRLEVGGTVVFEGRLNATPGADIIEGLMVPPQTPHPVDLQSGQEVAVTLAHRVDDDAGHVGVSFQLNLLAPHGTDDEEIERAAALSAESDVAIVVVGTTEEVESEGFDRASLALPGRQDELVRRVAGANPRTVVVVNAGAPVLMPWADAVAAVLLAWFPGQEFGNALADVLLGLAEPGGRLPTTWPRSEAGLPSTLPVDGVLAYDEGIAVGYRAAGEGRLDVLYPFGHGLGFSSWIYEAIDAPAQTAVSGDTIVEVRLRNTGDRHSREIVQVYLSRPGSAVARPARWLAAFAAVHAEPGATVTASVTVPRRAFEHWGVDAGGWALEPGEFHVAAGSSSATLPLSAPITILPN